MERLNTTDNQLNSRVESPTDSSDSSGADDRENETSKVAALEEMLAENPLSYDTHVEYIRCVRKLGDIQKLRAAREAMNAIFPLNSAMWQEWAHDEASLSTGSEGVAVVEKIYERGVKEYLSVSLWCDFIRFIEDHDPSVSACTSSGILKMRDLFERALAAAGLHALEGHKIWEAYRRYEQAILFTIDESNIEEKAKQVQQIRSLFCRQLSVPHSMLRSALVAYKTWEIQQGNIIGTNVDDLEGLPASVVGAYEMALQMYNVRMHYEELVSNKDISDAERLQHYMVYLTYEESCGDPARVQILYERAVAEYPISSDLWIGYTYYLDKTLKASSVVRSVYSRAVRSCTWIGELWSRYLLSLERASATEAELLTVFEQGLHCAFSSIEEYLDLFLTRVDSLRRRIPANDRTDEGLGYSLIRQTFQRAAEYLLPHLKGTECLLQMYAYWARLEHKLGNDLAAARGVWENLIRTSGLVLSVWQNYIAMEIEVGCINEARSIFKRCYSKKFPSTGSEDICVSWLRFEREFGSLEDYDYAKRKVAPLLEELHLLRSRQEAQILTLSTGQKENRKKNVSKKRRSMAKLDGEQFSSMWHQDSNLRKTEELMGSGFMEDTAQASLESDAKFSGGAMLSAPSETANKPIYGQKSTIAAIPKVEKRVFHTDQCTAFISNLHIEVTEENLRDFFGDGGGVTSIRLLKDKFSGRSRGLAYVDFSDEEHLSAAVAKTKQKLLGRKLSIARSDPMRGRKKASSGSGSQGRGEEASYGRSRSTTSEMKEQNMALRTSKSQPPASSVSHRRGGHVQLLGKNTFAVPRSVVRPLGWSVDKPRMEEGIEEKPKSNEEFRKMLMEN